MGQFLGGKRKSSADVFEGRQLFNLLEHLFIPTFEIDIKKLTMKHLLFALFFTFCSSHAYAQVRIGLSTGPNLSFWTWKIEALNWDLNLDPAVGTRTVVLGEWQVSPVLGVRTEMGAQFKANKDTRYLLFESDILAGTPGSLWKFRENYLYWEGSLLAQISPLKKVRPFYLLTGGTVGRLVSGRRKSSGSETGIKHSSKGSIDVKDGNWNRLSITADMGLGGNIPLGKYSILKVEGRFQYGLSQLAKSNEVDARVNSVLFTLGYLHRL
jgi:hypothetical protein